MPPEAKDTAFLEAFYEMKSDIKSIKQQLSECSRTAGRCGEHHDYITARNAVDENSKHLIWKVSALTGIVTALLTLGLKALHLI